MSSGGSNPEDLSVRARRGVASLEEERELERAFRSSAALRVAHAVGLDLDRSTAVRPGDEELILAAADSALRRVSNERPAAGARTDEGAIRIRAGSRRPPRKVAAALLAAATISASGMAAAWWSGLAKVPWVGRAEPAATVTAAPKKAARLAHAAAKPDAPPVEAVTVASAAPAVTEPAVTEPAVTEAALPSGSSRAVKRAQRALPPRAGELFSLANSARRAGDFSSARRLYGELIAKYPASDEARLSQVSLGKLLLASGDPAEAEREFSNYLSNGHEPLAEEALVSQAESFNAMKRRLDEQKAWQKLVSEYPASVYAARARARLAALRDQASPSGP